MSQPVDPIVSAMPDADLARVPYDAARRDAEYMERSVWDDEVSRHEHVGAIDRWVADNPVLAFLHLYPADVRDHRREVERLSREIRQYDIESIEDAAAVDDLAPAVIAAQRKVEALKQDAHHHSLSCTEAGDADEGSIPPPDPSL